MFTFIFIVLFVIPPVLFLVGAVFLQSAHLLFGGLAMTLVSAIYYAVAKGIKNKKQETNVFSISLS